MTTFDLSTLDALPEHRRLLQRAWEHFEADPRVAGLAMSGSVASGGADSYSDIDLDVIAHDADFDALFADRDGAAEAIGQPLFRFIADHLPFGSFMYIVLYDGPVKVDFSYQRVSQIEPHWTMAKRLVLKDADGFLARVISQSQGLAPDQPLTDSMVSLNQKFWTWCWYVLGKIVRGELWEALDGVHAIRSIAILPMLGWAAGQPREGYRRLESKISSEVAKKLAATVPSLEPDKLYAALLAEVALFSDLRTQVFARYGLSYDPRPEQVLREKMSQHWLTRGG